jgi:putative hemolysin
MKKAEALGLGISGLVSGISVAFKPIVWFLSVSTNAILRLIGIDPNEADEQVNEEEILMMVDAGSEKGAIDEQERAFIQNVFAFDDLIAEEIAVHRTEVTILWMEDSVEEWAKTIHDSRHTLYPVCQDSADNIIGILNAKDYFRLDDKSRENIMQNAVKAPFFVPETIKADVLFRKMKKTRNIMAIVLDEYGGMVGIITLNDLIEQLVGDLGEDTPEEEAAEPHVEQMNENTWAIIGNVELYDIEQALDVDIGLEEVETFTGLVFGELDMIPDDGEQDIELDFKGLHIHITKVEDHQISYATVTKLADSEENVEKI